MPERDAALDGGGLDAPPGDLVEGRDSGSDDSKPAALSAEDLDLDRSSASNDAVLTAADAGELDASPSPWPHDGGARAQPSDVDAARDADAAHEQSLALPPFVVDVSPEDGSLGVRAGESLILILTFSESMNTASVEEALSASWFPETPETRWSDDARTLEVPLQLDYAETPVTYAYSLSTSAESASASFQLK